MTCYHPLTAYVHLEKKTDSGKKLICFSTPDGFDQYEEIKLPCGNCIGCRLERSRQWAIRCVHEALTHEKSCFVTLTYDDDHLHPSGDLRFCKRDFVLFMKRLRKKFGKGIRFMHCGEYGSKFQRPHHHVILFGFDFDDKYIYRRTSLGYFLYRSCYLERLWPFGFSTVGACTFETCAYVARYIVKKVNGDLASDHYYGRLPEYISMSRMPGIGYKWLMDHPEIYNYDEIVIRNNLKCKPPRYYDRKFEEIAPDFMEDIKDKRKSAMLLKGCVDNERLGVREEFKLLQAKKLLRSYESEC